MLIKHKTFLNEDPVKAPFFLGKFSPGYAKVFSTNPEP